MAASNSGFIYLWYDRRNHRYYVGSHWGFENDGYICSSSWMKQAYSHRPEDFKRRILTRNIPDRVKLYEDEQRWLNMIKPEERKVRYYNLTLSSKDPWYQHPDKRMTIGQRISAAKLGKNTGPRDPSIGAKISEAKLRKNAERLAAGIPLRTPEQLANIAMAAKSRGPRSEEAKAKSTSALLEYQRNNPSYWTGKKQSEEHVAARVAGRAGFVPSDEQRAKVAISNSSEYTMVFKDGRVETVRGLKAYAREHDIPYVTLNKAVIHGKAVHKYGISSVTKNL